jgi:hypothetical protein
MRRAHIRNAWCRHHIVCCSHWGHRKH